MTAPQLDRETLLRAFRSLDERLHRAHVNADVFVFGGAAMVMGYDARPATRDVDAVWRPHGAVQKAAWAVAAELGLQQSWLNEQASFYLPVDVAWSGATMFAGSSLRVIQAPPELLLAMKVRAGRPIDLDDVVVLAKHLGLETSESIVALAERVFDEPLAARLVLRIEDRFD